MPKTKKLKKYFISGLRLLECSMEKASKRLLLFGCAAVSLTYGCAALTLLESARFPDFSTALFWSGELLTLGKELLGATFVPVLLFELFLTASGKKS